MLKIASKKNRKKQPKVEDEQIQKCIPECLQMYVINKQIIDISDDLKVIHPNINQLFQKYNRIFFDNKLEFCIVKWSEDYKSHINMLENAGYCQQKRDNICYIYLSKPILQYRPTKDIIETLLHEMIHAFLFIFDIHSHDRSDHGKRYIAIMNAINYCLKGVKIEIYHYCNDECEHIKLTIFQCNGHCQKIIERPKNKPPGKHEKWWNKHKRNCNGKFIMIQDNFKQHQSKRRHNRKRKLNDNRLILTSPNKKRKIDSNNNKWSCSKCTFMNKYQNTKCEICDNDNESDNDSDIEILK